MSLFKLNALTISASALILLASSPLAQAAELYNSAPATTAAAPAAAAPAATVTANTAPSTTAAPAAPATSTAAATTQPAAAPAAPASAQATSLGKQAGAACPGKWDSAECLSVISTSNLDMLSNYGAALKNKGLEADAEQVKQHCAASTAAQKQAFPGYAMKSAFIECANLIADVSQKTGVQPDLGQYQLMVGATMCLDNDVRCPGITEQLKTLAAK